MSPLVRDLAPDFDFRSASMSTGRPSPSGPTGARRMEMTTATRGAVTVEVKALQVPGATIHRQDEILRGS